MKRPQIPGANPHYSIRQKGSHERQAFLPGYAAAQACPGEGAAGSQTQVSCRAFAHLMMWLSRIWKERKMKWTFYWKRQDWCFPGPWSFIPRSISKEVVYSSRAKPPISQPQSLEECVCVGVCARACVHKHKCFFSSHCMLGTGGLNRWRLTFVLPFEQSS